MNKPHKHAELIKAWADGAEIQYLEGRAWWDLDNPTWDENASYRIKPKPVLCRLYTRGDFSGVCVVQDHEIQRLKVLNLESNVEWLTPWFNPEDIKETT